MSDSQLFAGLDIYKATIAVAVAEQGRTGDGPQDGLHGMRKNLALAKTVRDAVGPDIELADAYKDGM
jgi:hypothetical protein